MLKFRRATPPNSEVISAHSLHFKPIFDPLLKKIVRGAPFPVGGALVRLGHSHSGSDHWKFKLGTKFELMALRTSDLLD